MLFFINFKNHLKSLFFAVPKSVSFIFIFSIIIMNLLASITVIQTKYLLITGGSFFSWIPFLVMDATTHYFGPKISNKLTFLGLICNLIFVFFLKIIYFSFSNNIYFISFLDNNNFLYSIFHNSLAVILASSIAFLLSGILNNYFNYFLGFFFKNKKYEKLEFFFRSYVSTLFGQFIDNFFFLFLLYIIFLPILNKTDSKSIFLLINASILEAFFELFTEIIFSPIGYNLTIKWRKENLKQTFV